MDHLKSVLVAVDFSSCSAAALRQASRIAAWGGAALAAFHVAEMPVYSVDPQPFFPTVLPEIGELVRIARARWATWAPAREAGAGADFDAVAGIPRLEILDRVRRDRPDLLVVGARGESEDREGVGATAAACVQRAPTRVLVVREGQVAPFRSVVACVDFSETSRAGLELAIRVAAQDGAALHILHVYDDPWRGAAPPASIQAAMPDFAARYARAVEDRLREFCEPLAHETGALKAIFRVVRAPSHGRGIVDYAASERIDLAVLGTRSKWNLRDFLWGSTAERVVRDARCCTLTVPVVASGGGQPQPQQE